MSRLPPVPHDALPPDIATRFETVRTHMGFVPNSLRALAHRPAILDAFLTFAQTVMGRPDDPLYPLRMLVAHVSSTVSGCRYCQAHSASNASRAGVTGEKLREAFLFETSPLFDARERAALNVAAKAGMTPNAVEDADIARLRQHFDDGECAELMAVIALYGFLNRWNDSLATDLEPEPAEFAMTELAPAGWQPGKHGRRE
jgi:uncharacterized peroxidase-related enzyme